jgi:nitroreductase
MSQALQVRMDFFEAVQARRSVRKFLQEPVPDTVIEKSLEMALLAPNSSNLQPWEFYWVQTQDKKARLVEACLSQNAAKTAQHLVVAVARIDTWNRNRHLLLSEMRKSGPTHRLIDAYYEKLIPMVYFHDPIGILGALRIVVFGFIGLFRPITRRPSTKRDLFEVVTKTTALACENFMLAITAQGYGSCPMEGFDERRVKRLLKLGRHARVVMVIGIGRINPSGIYGPQIRLDQNLFIKKV